jgi:hypothetical protein
LLLQKDVAGPVATNADVHRLEGTAVFLPGFLVRRSMAAPRASYRIAGSSNSSCFEPKACLVSRRTARMVSSQ